MGMKIAIPTSSNDIHESLDPRFGRAKYFALYDDVLQQWSFIPNEQNLSLPQGAGIQSAKHIIDSGANILLTRNIGPKAFDLLVRADIKIYACNDDLPLAEAVRQFQSGSLKEIQDPTQEGHW